MNRRQALRALGGLWAAGGREDAGVSAAAAVSRAAAEPPEPIRNGWSCVCVAPGPEGRASLRWQLAVAGPARLRITVAFDARENLRVRAAAAKSGETLGAFDIRFAYPFQPFDLPLTARQAERVSDEGADLILEQGNGPLWLLSGAPSEAGHDLLPHLRRESRVSGGDFEAALATPAIAQPFGWMEGCVLDGLQQRWALLRSQRDREAMDWHFRAFFDGRAMPRYVPHADAPVRHGSEGLLPFAVLAKHDPAHPSFDGMLEFCQHAAAGMDGVIIDGRTTTAEGCYTLAYPLAALGASRDDRGLRALAVKQLEHRIERLGGRGVLYLRANEHGGKTFPNWARGVAWFFLGLVRTMNELPPGEIPGAVREAFVWSAELAMKWQNRQGLWHCFIDQPETGVETSGSAGIAAALAAGARLLPNPLRAVRAARAAHRELLRRHLVAGGFLGGASQANRDGERLQRSGYRVIAHYGAGLLAQLDAHVRAMS